METQQNDTRNQMPAIPSLIFDPVTGCFSKGPLPSGDVQARLLHAELEVAHRRRA